MGSGLIALFLYVSLSFANESKWYDNRFVSQISIESPFGTKSDLNQLLSSQLGEPISLNNIHQDIRTLYLAGNFSDVQVEAIPLFFNGFNKAPDIHLVYSVRPAPILTTVNISANYRRIEALITDKISLSLGQVFYFQNEKNTIKNRIQSVLYSKGYNNPTIEFKTKTNEELNVELSISITVENENKIHAIRYVGLPNTLKNEIKLLLWTNGVAEGRRFDTSKLLSLKSKIKNLLFQEGWFQARVNFPYVPNSQGNTVLTLRIETGPKYRLITSGYSLPTGNGLFKTLGIYPGDRITKADGNRLSTALKRHLLQKGYLSPKIQIRFEGDTTALTIYINVEEGERWTVKSLIFNGNKHFTNTQLKNAINESSPLLNSNIYSEQEWQESKKILTDVYKGHGFLDVSIKTKMTHSKSTSLLFQSSQAAELTFSIVEGTQYTFGTINYKGGNADIINSLNMKSGEDYFPKKITEISKTLVSMHQDLGFLNANVTNEIKVHETEKNVDVSFTIDQGEMVRLRSIIIKGNRKTNIDVIENALLIEVGLPLRLKDLNQSRRNLYALDLFRNIQIERFGDASEQQDLVITLDEKPNWQFTLGGGLTTDQGIQFGFTAEHRNLFGRANRLKLLAQAGIGWQGDSWRLDVQEQLWRVALRFNSPNVYQTTTDFFSEILLQELIQEPNYNFFRSGLGFGLTYKPFQSIKTFAEYRINRIELDEFNRGMLIDGDPWQQIEGLSRWASGPSLSVIYDGRDNPISPTEGNFVSAQLQISDGAVSLLSTEIDPIRFLKLYTDVSKIIKLEHFSLKVAAAGGIAYAGDSTTLPFDDRFYLGGINSLRGFNRNSVGPANVTTRPNIAYPDEIESMVGESSLRLNPNQWVATGGDYVSRLSLEVQYPLTEWVSEKISLIAFYDIGTIGFLSQDVLTNTPNQEFETNKPFRYGIGLGLQFRTPVGPITVDVGLNPDRIVQRNEPLYVFTMSMGSL